MIRLNCFFEASNAVSYDKAIDAAKSLSMKAQKHEGCIVSDVFSSETRSDVFMICETWNDQESLDAFRSTPEYKKKMDIFEEAGKMKIESFNF